MEAIKPERGISCPATGVLGKLFSTGYEMGINQNNGELITNVDSVSKLSITKIMESMLKKHIGKCENYLYNLPFQNDLKSIGQLTLAEKRVIAIAIIELDPDLSHGSLSIAGHLNKKRKKEGTIREMDLTYEYGQLETLAFPTLIGSSNFFQGGNLDELRHYINTLMRLHSADKSCRNDPDYVSFSIHHLAAFGCGRAKKDCIKMASFFTIP